MSSDHWRCAPPAPSCGTERPHLSLPSLLLPLLLTILLLLLLLPTGHSSLFSSWKRGGSEMCPPEKQQFVYVPAAGEADLGEAFQSLINGFLLSLLVKRTLVFDPWIIKDSAMIAMGGCPGVVKRMIEKEIIPFEIGDPIDWVRMQQEKENDYWQLSLQLSRNHWIKKLLRNQTWDNQEILNLADEGRLSHVALRALLQPPKEAQVLISKVLRAANCESNCYLIGVHLRTGNLTQSSVKGMGKKASHAYRTRYASPESFLCFVSEAIASWKELTRKEKEKYPGGPLFFVSSDSEMAVQAVRELFERGGFKSTDSSQVVKNIANFALSPNPSREFLDWWILTQSKFMVLTPSGFSELASKYSCTPTSVFVNLPRLKNFNNYTYCTSHFRRFRGEGTCVPEIDDTPALDYILDVYG